MWGMSAGFVEQFSYLAQHPEVAQRMAQFAHGMGGGGGAPAGEGAGQAAQDPAVAQATHGHYAERPRPTEAQKRQARIDGLEARRNGQPGMCLADPELDAEYQAGFRGERSMPGEAMPNGPSVRPDDGRGKPVPSEEEGARETLETWKRISECWSGWPFVNTAHCIATGQGQGPDELPPETPHFPATLPNRSAPAGR